MKNTNEKPENYEEQINEFYLYGVNRNFNFEIATVEEVSELMTEYIKAQLEFHKRFNSMDKKQKARILGF